MHILMKPGSSKSLNKHETDENQGNGKREMISVGDRPQEPQGLNTVFAQDTETLELIKEYNDVINK